MRNMVLLAAGVSLLARCATKEMKSTPFYEGGEVSSFSGVIGAA